MNSRFALTVIFEDTLQKEYVEQLINAIKCFQGVLDVVEHEVTPEIYWAKRNALMELQRQIVDILWPDRKPRSLDQ